MNSTKEIFGCKYHPGGYNLIEDQREGTVLCSQCGLVVVEQVARKVSEWNGDDPERSRIGDQINRFVGSEKNLSTSIVAAGGSASRSGYVSSVLRGAKRKCADNGILKGLTRLADMAERINLSPSVLNHAQYLYAQMYRQRKYKGIVLMVDAKTAACMYIACQKAQCPRTLNEMSSITESNQSEILRAIKMVSKVLNIELDKNVGVHFIPRFCGELGLPIRVERAAIKIINKFSVLKVKRRFDPEIIAATAIYFATRFVMGKDFKRSYSQIAACFGIQKDVLSIAAHHYNAIMKRN